MMYTFGDFCTGVYVVERPARTIVMEHGPMRPPYEYPLGTSGTDQHTAHTALVIDSNVDDAALLVKCLQEANYETNVADSAQHAREAMQQHAFDLLFLDTTLRDENGLQLCNELRERFGAGLVIVFVASDSSPTSRIVGLELGADDFILKPWDAEELVARVEAHLARARILAQDLQHRHDAER